MIVRRLRPGEENVVIGLATYSRPSVEHARRLLSEPSVVFLVAFEHDEPVGFVLAYELVRRHGDPTSFFVYEVETAERHRRRGIATELLRALAELARERGIRSGFVLTERENEPAMRLYESAGGVVEGEDVVWEFDYGAS